MAAERGGPHPDPGPPSAVAQGVVENSAVEQRVSEPPHPGPSRPAVALRAGGSIVSVLLLALLAWATLVPSKGETLVARIAAGEAPPAPGFELPVFWNRRATWPQELAPAAADGRLGVEELRGRPVVLNFWASWCIPCRDEAPILNDAARAHRGQVAFVGVNVKDLRRDALGFLREFDVAYPSVRDRGDKVFDSYGLTGVPETYYLDRSGRIVAHAPGPITPGRLEAGIRAARGALAETRPGRQARTRRPR